MIHHDVRSPDSTARATAVAVLSAALSIGQTTWSVRRSLENAHYGNTEEIVLTFRSSENSQYPDHHHPRPRFLQV